MQLVTVRSTVIDVSTSSEHNERQANPDVAAQPPDVTALHERLSRLEAVVFPDDPTRWVPLSRASQITGIPHRTLNLYAATDRCPAHKFRGQWYVDPTWVASQAAQRPKGTAS